MLTKELVIYFCTLIFCKEKEFRYEDSFNDVYFYSMTLFGIDEQTQEFFSNIVHEYFVKTHNTFCLSSLIEYVLSKVIN